MYKKNKKLRRRTRLYENEFTPQYPIEYEPIDYNQILFLTKQQKRERGFNTHISEEKLKLIPEHLRKYWYKLDLDYLDVEPPKFPDKDPISKLTETPPDLFQMMRDNNKRIKLKAIALGELNEKSELIKEV